MTADWIGERGGANRYGYVGGNPVSRLDPAGLCLPGDGDCIDSDGDVFEALITGGISAKSISQFMWDIFKSQFLKPKLGDLAKKEIRKIQEVVDEAGRPLEVIGSAARGERRFCPDPNAPIGKNPGEVSDIDYIAPPGSHPYFEGRMSKLPLLDPKTGIIPGSGNPNIGPVIRFEPNAPPSFTPMPEPLPPVK